MSNGCSLPQSQTTIPTMLKAGGYQSAHFGKLHLVPIISRTETSPSYGFDTCEVSEGDQQLIDDAHFRWLRKKHPDTFLSYFQEMWREGHADGYTSKIPEEQHLSSWTTSRALEWLEKGRDREKPFFLQVSFFDPHHAFNPCEPYASMFENVDVGEPVFNEQSMATRPQHYRDSYSTWKEITSDKARIKKIRQSYHAMVAHIDVCVGRLIDELRKQRLADDTIIMFTSDHGEMLGNHGLLYKGPFMLDDLLHVPLIAGIADGTERNIRTAQLSSAVDFFATFANIAGITDAPSNSGNAFLNADLSLAPEGKRDFILAEWEDLDARHQTSGLRCIRTERSKLITYKDPSVGEFYDLQSDPNEFINHFWNSNHSAEKKHLHSLLQTCYPAKRAPTPVEAQW
jgi:arylsulfatase A-like enzyme